MVTHRGKPSPVMGNTSLGRGFGLPSASKFQSGHMSSGVVPALRPIAVSGNDGGGSGSDMDTSTDSDEDVGGGPKLLHRYSIKTNAPVHTQFSSNNDIMQRKQGHGVKGLGGGGWGRPVARPTFNKDNLSDSIKSPRVSVPTGLREQGLRSQKLADDDLPSAPPFSDCVQEINAVSEQVLTFRAYDAPSSENSGGSATTNVANTIKSATLGSCGLNSTANMIPSVSCLPARLPIFHASGLGLWYSVVTYDACVRLCLHSWASGCMEAPVFLANECKLLQNAFGLQNVLLKPEEELLQKRSSELVSEGASVKPKKTFGKMKVQVRKVKMVLDPPSGCNFSSLKPPKVKLESVRFHLSNVKSTLSSEWQALRKVRVPLHIPANGSFSRRSLAYVHAGTQYLKEVSGVLKIRAASLHGNSPSYEVVQETYACSLRLKSSSAEDAVRMQPGSGESHIFLPDGLGDDLVVEVFDSKGESCGRVIAQVADIADNLGDKLRWWPIYHEPEHELVGRIQLFINYSTSLDENGHLKCGSVAETVAYDLVLEAAMKTQHIQQRNLLLHGPWRWLVTEFALHYGVSDAYTKLRYLSYIMDVATPTADFLNLVHDLLLPVVMKGNNDRTLSHQENRILGEISDLVEQAVSLVFENYKSLDESSLSGMVDFLKPATGSVAPALAPALKLYALLHDILSSEAQLKLCRYFQAAVKTRSRRHLAETEEYLSNNNENILMDSVTFSLAFQKMISLCCNIRNEIFTDIEIHNQNVLPSFIDLPNLSSSIYSTELCNRLRAFLVAFPPTGPSSPVTELVIATADFQRDLTCWNISPIKGGVDAKGLFHSFITCWIENKRLALLESCKHDKVKWSEVKTQHSTTPFLDDMYDRLKETLGEFEIVIRRWPEYTSVLENAIADVERAILETLDKQYGDVLSPLKENPIQNMFGLKYVQKIAKGNVCTYTVPVELGILLNSMKRMLDVLRPKIEAQLKSWVLCIPDGGNAVPGECLSEVTVILRTKFRNYLQSVVEKLGENVGALQKTRLRNATKLKKIIQDSEGSVVDSDVRSRMQPLKDLLIETIDYLYKVFETNVFLIICRGFWDRMGQDVKKFLDDRKEKGSWYKGSRVALSVVDDTFASQMQQLMGNALQEKDLEPPRSIMEVRSMLCKDAMNQKDNNYYY